MGDHFKKIHESSTKQYQTCTDIKCNSCIVKTDVINTTADEVCVEL